MKKVFEVHVNGKLHWIIAGSKKTIKDFFFNSKVEIFLRKDVEQSVYMEVIS
jgi:hypothetical protein